MRTIEAINIALRALGHSNIVDDQTPNPNAGHIKSALEQARRSVLGGGWWFNTVLQTITVPASGRVTIPYNTMNVYSTDNTNPNMMYSFREGNLLYDIINRSYVFTEGDVLHLKFVLDMDFEDLPHYAAQYIAYLAAYEVYINDMGYDNNAASLQQTAVRLFAELRAQELRAIKSATYKKPRFNKMNRLIRM